MAARRRRGAADGANALVGHRVEAELASALVPGAA